MTKKDLIRLVERLPEESVEPVAKLLEAVLKLSPREEDPDEEWLSLRGIYKGQELTKGLEEEHARERERDAKKAGR